MPMLDPLLTQYEKRYKRKARVVYAVLIVVLLLGVIRYFVLS
jgi:hypothetical protein